MKRISGLAVSCLVLTLAGCGSDIAHDLNTPEGAILSLEDAYRAGDLEAAVSCKDFTVEATLMLQKLEHDFSGDEEILSKTAEVLELGFRSELTNTGFPDFRGVVSTFADKKPYQERDDVVQITETCQHADGSTTNNQLIVAKTPDGWKVVTVPD
jgi:hypothetical protein